MSGTQHTQFFYNAGGTLVRKVDPRGTTAYVSADDEIAWVVPTQTLTTISATLTHKLYMPMMTLGTFNVANGVSTTYYRFNGARVAMRTVSTVYWLHGDHLGSVSLTTSITGTKVSEMRYYPFSEVRWQNGSTPTDRTFTGQLAEPSGLGSLMNYNAREYSPVLGRFISADSIVPRPDDPQSLNRFAYALGNPLKYTDPSGHACKCTNSGYVCDNPTEQTIWDKYWEWGKDSWSAAQWASAYQAGLANAENGGAPGDTRLIAVGMSSALLPEGNDRYAVDASLAMAFNPEAYAAGMAQQFAQWTGQLSAVVVFASFNAAQSRPGATATNRNLVSDLTAAAKRAAQKVGPGSGSVYGTHVHTEFRIEVNNLNNPNLGTGVSYLNGMEVHYGTAGSVRLDIVEYGPQGQVVRVFDLKTGTATLTAQRIAQIQLHVGAAVPVVEIRP